MSVSAGPYPSPATPAYPAPAGPVLAVWAGAAPAGAGALAAATAAPRITLQFGRVIFTAVKNATNVPPVSVNLTNTGGSPLTIKKGAITLTGVDASRFTFSATRSLPATLAPGESLTLGIGFRTTSLGAKGAVMHVATNDPARPTASLTLRGLGVAGRYGALEPSLQRILDTYESGTKVGDENPATSPLPATPAGQNDEVAAQAFVAAGAGAVQVAPIAAFTNASSPALRFGWYPASNPAARTLLGSVPGTNTQTMLPAVNGTTKFSPGTTKFGVVTIWPPQGDRVVYSNDALNTWGTTADERHAVRVYKFRDANGAVVANTYVVAVEEASNRDYQDAVFVIRNVVPVAP